MTADLRQPEVKPGHKFGVEPAGHGRGAIACWTVNLRKNQQSESFPEPQGRSVGCGPGFILSWLEAKFWETATSDTGIRSQDQAGSAEQAIKISRASELQRCSF